MLGFETLTFAPIDRALIAVDMLTPQEIAWVNDYHNQVRALIGPQLPQDVSLWLERETAPL